MCPLERGGHSVDVPEGTGVRGLGVRVDARIGWAHLQETSELLGGGVQLTRAQEDLDVRPRPAVQTCCIEGQAITPELSIASTAVNLGLVGMCRLNSSGLLVGQREGGVRIGGITCHQGNLSILDAPVNV